MVTRGDRRTCKCLADGRKRIHASAAGVASPDVRSVRAAWWEKVSEKQSWAYAVFELDGPCESHEAAANGTPRNRHETLTMGIGNLRGWLRDSIASWQIGPLRGWYFKRLDAPPRMATTSSP